MKKLRLLLLATFTLFVFVGCTSTVNNSQKNEPISVTIQQFGVMEKPIKITDKDDLNQIINFIKSTKWTSDVSLLSNKQANGCITFQYRAYSKDNKLSDDNPYKFWINEDKSVTFQSFSGKVNTISEEDTAKYKLIFKYFEIK